MNVGEVFPYQFIAAAAGAFCSLSAASAGPACKKAFARQLPYSKESVGEGRTPFLSPMLDIVSLTIC